MRIIILFALCEYAHSCAFISVIELPRIPAVVLNPAYKYISFGLLGANLKTLVESDSIAAHQCISISCPYVFLLSFCTISHFLF